MTTVPESVITFWSRLMSLTTEAEETPETSQRFSKAEQSHLLPPSSWQQQTTGLCSVRKSNPYESLTHLLKIPLSRFRLIAYNEFGRSRPSEAATYCTQGTVPQQPEPPGLKEATKSSLHLVSPLGRVSLSIIIGQQLQMNSDQSFKAKH